MNQMSGDDDGRQCAALRWLESDIPIEQVPVALLQDGESPRLKSDSKVRGIRLRAATGVPPIIVHRSTMGVIDGRARVAAARQRHQDTIAAQFFEDGSTDEAFVLGVLANNATTHGRPLSRQDRKADAARILQMHPGWSDHLIASMVGLTHPTVATIRRRSTSKSFQSNTRRGRDGTSRPVDANHGRRAAAALIRADESTSLREVARQAGVSVSTAHDVRCRIRQGRDPAVSTARHGPSVDYHLARAQAALTKLENNPAVRSHTDGKTLLRLLHACLRPVQHASSMIPKAPEHCLNTVADLAWAISDAWGQLAREIRAHAKHRYTQRN